MARVLTLLLVHAAAVALCRADGTSTPKPKKVLDTIMSPKALPPEEKHGWYWKKTAEKILKAKLQEKPNMNKAKNGILFIGDGMSVATIMAARTYGGQVENGVNGEENILEFEKFPIIGLARDVSPRVFDETPAPVAIESVVTLMPTSTGQECCHVVVVNKTPGIVYNSRTKYPRYSPRESHYCSHTYCIDAQVPDSACTATSYLTGVKTKYGVIGLDGNVTRGSCYSQLHEKNRAYSIGQWALDKGLDVGLVTTTRVTHASPAGMYAHTSERNWESDADVPDECLSLGCQDIAKQLMTSDTGRQFKVILGGGRREFLPNISDPLVNSTGRRLDGVDLIEKWHLDKVDRDVTHQYVSDRNELLKVINSDEVPEYLLGLFHDDHMAYHLKANSNQPTLEELVEAAIKLLSRSANGYFLFVEGGRIDHAHHDSLAHLALDETVEYSKAVKRARALTDEDDTLIVVSSDHAHTMTVAGYPSRGNDILGLVDTAHGDDGIPYTTISYANGKANSIGADGRRVDVSLHQQFMSRDVGYSYPSLVPLDSETHGGEDVAVFASGPWQHLFTSSYEQSVLPHLIAYAMCLTEDKHPNCKHKSSFGGLWSSSAVINRPSIVMYILSLTVIFSVIFR